MWIAPISESIVRLRILGLGVSSNQKPRDLEVNYEILLTEGLLVRRY